jgi:hypothetical protein
MKFLNAGLKRDETGANATLGAQTTTPLAPPSVPAMDSPVEDRRRKPC